MSEQHQFSISSFNAPTVLPRLTLVFTRRGIAIDALAMTTDADAAQFDINAYCNAEIAQKVAVQLRRVVEVNDVCVESMAEVASAVAS